MSRKYKLWTKAEKLEILYEDRFNGVLETCRKYDLSTGNYYNWKKTFEEKGEVGFRDKIV